MPIHYEAEFDLDTLKRAGEIRKNPERMAAVKAEMEKQITELKKIKMNRNMDTGMKDGFRKLS